MKYIDLLNRFWEANRADRFTTSERELYYYPLNECNRNYWRMPVACPTSVVCAVIGINRATLMRAREGLRSRGLIRFEEGVQNSRAPTYTILDTSCDTGNATATATAADTAGAISYTIHKSNTNTFSQKDAPLPIDELERRLTTDREWHEQIVRQLPQTASLSMQIRSPTGCGNSSTTCAFANTRKGKRENAEAIFTTNF